MPIRGAHGTDGTAWRGDTMDVRTRDIMGLTQGRLVANGIAQEVPGAHGGQLRETFHEPLRLCSFTNARRTDENDASGVFEFPSGHSKAVCTST